MQHSIRGIALISCYGVKWNNPSDPALSTGSRNRDITCTYDGLVTNELPCKMGPTSVYIIVGGDGHQQVSLMLEAPNGETIVAYHFTLDYWGTIGTNEWPVHIDEVLLREVGIYKWVLYHNDVELLCRPFLLTYREAAISVASNQ